MNERWRARLVRLAQLGEEIGRRLERAAVASAEWHDRYQARQRQKFLRQGGRYSTLLGLWLALIGLELLEHQPAGIIHGSAGVGLFLLALKIWHSAMVVRAKNRGEL
jgi:hypothetical protein